MYMHTSSDCIHDSKAHVYAHLLRLYPRLKGRLAALTLTPANECTRRADLRAHAHMSCATWVGICAHVMHMLMDMLRGGIGLWCIPHSLPLPTPYDSLYSPLPTTPYYSLLPNSYSPLPTPRSPLPTPYSLLPTPYFLYLPTSYSLLPTPYSLFPTPHSPLPTPSPYSPLPTQYTHSPLAIHTPVQRLA